MPTQFSVSKNKLTSPTTHPHTYARMHACQPPWSGNEHLLFSLGLIWKDVVPASPHICSLLDHHCSIVCEVQVPHFCGVDRHDGKCFLVLPDLGSANLEDIRMRFELKALHIAHCTCSLACVCVDVPSHVMYACTST